MNIYKSSSVITLKSYPKILVICKLFEVNRPWHDFTQVDPIAEIGPEDLPEEHLPEALKLKTGEKSIAKALLRHKTSTQNKYYNNFILYMIFQKCYKHHMKQTK